MINIRKLLYICVSAVLLMSCSQQVENSLNWEIEDFSFDNEEGTKTKLDDYKGKVWVADFIFTNCNTVCPPMTANMAKLQTMAAEEGLEVEFVSFSVDPEMDTAENLKKYGLTFTDDITNWRFLTGYSQAEIEEFAVTNFKAAVRKEEGNDQVDHGVYFYVIDGDKVVSYYKGNVDVPYEEILQDIRVLQ